MMIVAKLKGSSAWPSEVNVAEAQGECGILEILEDLERVVVVMTVKVILCKEKQCKELEAQSIEWRCIHLAPGKPLKNANILQ